jgi:hypothetical protein
MAADGGRGGTGRRVSQSLVARKIRRNKYSKNSVAQTFILGSYYFFSGTLLGKVPKIPRCFVLRLASTGEKSSKKNPKKIEKKN